MTLPFLVLPLLHLPVTQSSVFLLLADLFFSLISSYLFKDINLRLLNELFFELGLVLLLAAPLFMGHCVLSTVTDLRPLLDDPAATGTPEGRALAHGDMRLIILQKCRIAAVLGCSLGKSIKNSLVVLVFFVSTAGIFIFLNCGMFIDWNRFLFGITINKVLYVLVLLFEFLFDFNVYEF